MAELKMSAPQETPDKAMTPVMLAKANAIVGAIEDAKRGVMTDTVLNWDWIETRLKDMKDVCLALQDDYLVYSVDLVESYEDLERRFRSGERTQELFTDISEWWQE